MNSQNCDIRVTEALQGWDCNHVKITWLVETGIRQSVNLATGRFVFVEVEQQEGRLTSQIASAVETSLNRLQSHPCIASFARISCFGF